MTDFRATLRIQQPANGLKIPVIISTGPDMKVAQLQAALDQLQIIPRVWISVML